MSNTYGFGSTPGDPALQGGAMPPLPGVAPSTELSEDAWRASLPSWGDPIDVGRRPAGSAPASAPVAPPARATAPLVQPASSAGQAVPPASQVAPPAAPVFAAPAAQPAPLLGAGLGLGPAQLSGGMSLPAIDPSKDSAGLTEHSITRTSRFPVAAGGTGGTAATYPSRQTAYKNWTPPPSHGNTAAVWWIVFLPLIYSAVMMVLFFFMLLPHMAGLLLAPQQAQQLDDPAVQSLFAFVALEFALALVYFVLTIWAGYRDRRALLGLGHTTTASPWWQLLSQFIYLIIRTVHVRRVSGKGAAPLVVWIVLYLVPPLLGVIAAIAIPVYLSSQGA